jgi:hypothetical protein
MNFYTIEFLIYPIAFFIFTYGIVSIVPGRKQKVIALVSSFLFLFLAYILLSVLSSYGFMDWKYALPKYMGGCYG